MCQKNGPPIMLSSSEKRATTVKSLLNACWVSRPLKPKHIQRQEGGRKEKQTKKTKKGEPGGRERGKLAGVL